MCFNHGSQVLLPLLNIKSLFWTQFHWYISRPAFLIFAYLIGEGMLKSKNKEKYILRLGLFALISEVPFDLALTGSISFTSKTNVFVTLFFGALGIYFIQKLAVSFIKKSGIGIILITLAVGFAADSLGSDYGFFGVFLIIILYLTRSNPKKMFIMALLSILIIYTLNFFSVYIFNWYTPYFVSIFANVFLELQALWGFVLISRYNGEKGRLLPKMFYYWFYPAHLIIFWLIAQAL